MEQGFEVTYFNIGKKSHTALVLLGCFPSLTRVSSSTDGRSTDRTTEVDSSNVFIVDWGKTAVRN